MPLLASFLTFGILIATLIFSVAAVYRERRQQEISKQSFAFSDPRIWNTWLLG